METEYTDTPCQYCENKTEDMGYIGLNKRVQCVKCTKITPTPEDLELKHEIEIALRDGLLDELTEQTVTGLDLIARLTQMVKDQEASIAKWEQLNVDLMAVAKRAVEDRDAARDLAIRLEAECHRCMDTVHHGNEEQY